MSNDHTRELKKARKQAEKASRRAALAICYMATFLAEYVKCVEADKQEVASRRVLAKVELRKRYSAREHRTIAWVVN